MQAGATSFTDERQLKKNRHQAGFFLLPTPPASWIAAQMNTEVNEILKVYLGAGASGGYLPHSHEERMRAAYGEHAISKLELIQKYLNEDHPMTDWTQKDYAKEASAFDLELAKKYPELDQTTLNALACRWSYGWR